MRKVGLALVLVSVGVWVFASRRARVAFGRLRGVTSALHPTKYDDATLKAKVESELFRAEHEVKGAVNVNAQEGIVQLRGELPSQDLIDALVDRAGRIHGVRDVENLLHTTGTEAPMHH